ncbi:DNA damage-inducible protein I [Serratia sp. M24T3]|uniref:DNA damage-inducible protein I n=1 Tax=Rouxiella sp. WC2420 TaxID=3234145 RepID=A0AB39VLC0_9GAMM|nr:DNA damage-inducible protein I [Serratia sp. M24T3]EIC83633.1 DNA damage-inducible protein I [Serratia sp. M24T3]
MRIEVCIDRTKPLPAGALEALSGELSKRINKKFSDTDNSVHVRYAGANNLTVMGGLKTDKDLIEEILQETWESADDWFSNESEY